MKTLRIGIGGYFRMKARTLGIARGEHQPAEGEPTEWFNSIESFAKVLSGCNREPLPLIAREKPDPLAEFAGQHKSNLSRTLKTMSRCGLAELNGGNRSTLVPRVPCVQVRLNVPLTASSRGFAWVAT